MPVKGWRYYNHAMIPTCAPHEEPDTTSVYNGEIWKNVRGGGALLARWTTDFDCQEETNWWYVIKDTPFDLSALKAKRRYEITKGKRNFRVEQIVPATYVEDIYQIQKAAYSVYPESYRPSVNREKLRVEIENWNWYKVYGAFSQENNKLCGYALLNRKGQYISFAVLKVYPECERRGINAAITAHILYEHHQLLMEGGYISDGAKNVQHETHFQDYLEKYFGFRKAYCLLHIAYNPQIKWLVHIMYPFRRMLRKLDHIGLVHKMNGVFIMQEIIEEQKKK